MSYLHQVRQGDSMEVIETHFECRPIFEAVFHVHRVRCALRW